MATSRSGRTAVDVGARIARARRSAAMSQATLARAIGLDRTALSKIESGRRKVGSVELARIAANLGRPIDSFVSEFPPARDPIQAVRRKRNAILKTARAHGARSIRVFGSVARGEAVRGSDVDFLVDMEPGRGLFDLAGMLLELQELLGCSVDVVTPEGLRDRIRNRVLRDAVPL